jgi:hypothetical protein
LETQRATNNAQLAIQKLMENEDIDMLVCTRTANTARPVYGSIRANCTECKSPVWVSQSGQKALRNRESLQPYCIECAQQKIKETDEEIKAEIVPGAIDELKRYFLKIEEN